MRTSTEEAVMAFRAANPVPPDGYEDAVGGPQAAVTLRRIMTIPPDKARGSWRRPVPIATVAAAAAVAAITISLGTAPGTGPAASRVTTAAYTVRLPWSPTSLPITLLRCGRT